MQCVAQLGELDPVAPRFRAAGIDVVTIGTDTVQQVRAAQQAALENGVDPIHMDVLCDPDIEVFRRWGVWDGFQQEPMHGTFLVDPRGRILWQDVGVLPFSEIEFLLAESQRLLTAWDSVDDPAGDPIDAAVFRRGMDARYHTFRIPAIVRAANGDLLAFAEGRVQSGSDSGDIDVVMRRSGDGGRTWGELSIVADNGDGVFGNPAPVVDRESGDVVLLLVRQEAGSHESQIRSGKHGSRTPYVMRSADHGKTWSEPRSLLESCDREGWGWYATGPCHAIQLRHGEHAGRLVVPANFSSLAHGGGNAALGAHLLLSDDAGETWRIGAVDEANLGKPEVNPNESTVAELADGRLYVNTRDHGGKSRATRAFAISVDGGETFVAPFQSVEGLVAPVCQGSVLADGEVLLFSGPSVGNKRERLAIRVSDDAGATWREALVIEPGMSAYSDLVALERNRYGVLFESDGYGRIRFRSFDRNALESRRSAASPPERK